MKDAREVSKLAFAGKFDELTDPEINRWLWGIWDSLPASLKTRIEKRDYRTGKIEVFEVVRKDLSRSKIISELKKAGVVKVTGGL